MKHPLVRVSYLLTQRIVATTHARLGPPFVNSHKLRSIQSITATLGRFAFGIVRIGKPTLTTEDTEAIIFFAGGQLARCAATGQVGEGDEAESCWRYREGGG